MSVGWNERQVLNWKGRVSPKAPKMTMPADTGFNPAWVSNKRPRCYRMYGGDCCYRKGSYDEARCTFAGPCSSKGGKRARRRGSRDRAE